MFTLITLNQAFSHHHIPSGLDLLLPEDFQMSWARSGKFNIYLIWGYMGLKRRLHQSSTQWGRCWGIFINNQDGCRWRVPLFVDLSGSRSIQSRPEAFCSATVDPAPSKSTMNWEVPEWFGTKSGDARLHRCLSNIWMMHYSSGHAARR